MNIFTKNAKPIYFNKLFAIILLFLFQFINCLSVAPQNLAHLFDTGKQMPINVGFQTNLSGMSIVADDQPLRDEADKSFYTMNIISFRYNQKCYEKLFIIPFIGFDGIGVCISYKYNNRVIGGIFADKSFYNNSFGYGLQSCLNIIDRYMFLNIDYFTGYIYDGGASFTSSPLSESMKPGPVIQNKMILKTSITMKLFGAMLDLGYLYHFPSKMGTYSFGYSLN
jgi:hypothetical protein